MMSETFYVRTTTTESFTNTVLLFYTLLFMQGRRLYGKPVRSYGSLDRRSSGLDGVGFNHPYPITSIERARNRVSAAQLQGPVDISCFHTAARHVGVSCCSTTGITSRARSLTIIGIRRHVRCLQHSGPRDCRRGWSHTLSVGTGFQIGWSYSTRLRHSRRFRLHRSGTAVEPGGGTVVVGVVFAIGGGIAGYWAGEKAGADIYDWGNATFMTLPRVPPEAVQ